MAQRERAGPITQRSKDRNLHLLLFSCFSLLRFFFLHVVFPLPLVHLGFPPFRSCHLFCTAGHYLRSSCKNRFVRFSVGFPRFPISSIVPGLDNRAKLAAVPSYDIVALRSSLVERAEASRTTLCVFVYNGSPASKTHGELAPQALLPTRVHMQPSLCSRVSHHIKQSVDFCQPRFACGEARQSHPPLSSLIWHRRRSGLARYRTNIDAARQTVSI